MTDAVIINLPELPVQLLPTLAQTDILRALPSISLVNGQDYLVNGNAASGDGGGGLFVWNAASTLDDNDRSIIRPNDLGPLQAGRWILLADPSAQIANAVATEVAALAASSGAGLVGWISRYASAIAGTVSDYLDDRCSVMHFIPFIERVKIRARTSTADLSAYFQAAAATGDDVWVPAGTYNVRAVTLSTAGTKFVGTGPSSILRQYTATTTMFDLKADDVGFENLRFDGSASSQNLDVFAISHDGVTAVSRPTFRNLWLSGYDAAHGLNNGIKVDANSFDAVFENIWVDRLWGSAAGSGYGILCGATQRPYFSNIHGVGSTGRGRHLLYKSAGCSYATGGNITAIGFQNEGVTINTHADQPTSKRNVLKAIVCVGCATAAPSFDEPLNLASVSIFGNSQDNDLEVFVYDSVGVGVKVDGTGTSGATGCANNTLRGKVVNSQLIGCDIIAQTGGNIGGLWVWNSSQIGSGTYSNVRIKSDGTTATTGLDCAGLRSDGPTDGTKRYRSAISFDNTAPVPSDIFVDGAKLGTGTSIDIEFNGLTYPINGFVDVSIAPFTLPAIASGTPYNTQIDIPWLQVGDTVMGHSWGGTTDNLSWTWNVHQDAKADLCIINGSSSSFGGGSHTLFLTLRRSRFNTPL